MQPAPSRTALQRQGPERDTEQAVFNSSRRIAGLEMLRARYVSHSFSRHAHEGYALGVITHGALAFRYMGRDCVAAAGSLNLVVPGEVHDGRGADEAGWAYRMFYLAPEIVRQAALEAGNSSALLPAFMSGVLHDCSLAQGVLALHRDMEQQGDGMPSLEQESRLLALLTRWVRVHGDCSTGMCRAGQEPRAVRLVKEYLAAHHAEDVRLETLAGHAGLSPFHLVRVFTRSTGLPPHAYQVQQRIAYARSLLTTALPLAEVALASGFSDQSHLTRQFKKMLGIPPGVYRKIVQER